MTVTFDPVRFKETTRQQWQDAAAAWQGWAPTIEAWLGRATTRMMDAAGIGPGDRVLDVAAGAGGQTLVAAKRVGPTGHVLATDISFTRSLESTRGVHAIRSDSPYRSSLLTRKVKYAPSAAIFTACW